MSVSDDFFPILFCFFSAFRDTKKFVTNFTHHSPFWIRFVIHIRVTWVLKILSACLGSATATTSAAILCGISDQIFHSAPSSILFLWNCEFFPYVLFACSTYVLAFAFPTFIHVAHDPPSKSSQTSPSLHWAERPQFCHTNSLQKNIFSLYFRCLPLLSCKWHRKRP